MACNCLVARSVRSSCIFTTNALKEAGWHADISNARLEESHGITKIQQQKRGSMVVISLLYAAIVVRLDGGYIYISLIYKSQSPYSNHLQSHGDGFFKLGATRTIRWMGWVGQSWDFQIIDFPGDTFDLYSAYLSLDGNIAGPMGPHGLLQPCLDDHGEA